MVDWCARRVAIRVETWETRKTPGDTVAAGETLGYFSRRPIRAPYKAVVENVAYERETHTWIVTLIEQVRCA